MKIKKRVVSSRRANKKPKQSTLPDRAAKWCVTLRTIQRWIVEGAPIDDEVAMVKWLAPKKSINDDTRRVIDAIREAHPEKFPRQDPDWLKWRADVEERKKSGASSEFETLEDVRDFWAFKLKVASEAGNQRGAEFATRQLVDIDKAIRDNKLAEKKLGIENGETITRAESEKWHRALGFWLMRSVDLMLDDLVPKLAGLAPTLTPELIRKAIEPGLLEARLLRPLVQATKVTGGVNLPAWLVAVVKDTADDYLENGGALFAQYGEPKP